MSDKAKPEGDGTASTFNPRRFRTTVPFYARYRLPYPDSLLGHVAERVGLKRGDAVLDLGCGPGLLAVPLARAGFAVTAVDPEPCRSDGVRQRAPCRRRSDIRYL